MSKTIVFFADGTWNGPDKAEKEPDGHAPTNDKGCDPQLTNVCKLFAWLAGDLLPQGTSWGGLEMEKALIDPTSNLPIQIAKYIHGVGDTANVPQRILEGAFGVGVTARIARGYTYISRNYKKDDRIVIVGFSRGAYTARALAGLIAGQGLLKPDLVAADDDTRFDTAAAAWVRWRFGHDNIFQKFLDFGSQLIEWRNSFSQARQLSKESFVSVKVNAVAVWDTVGEMGIPAYRAGGVADMFKFCDTSLNDNILLGVHAVALDERREPFTPTLWDEGQRITQALFPGGHCDVGGGYPDHGLSDGPLIWVADRLQHPDVGLKLNTNPPCEINPNPCALRHCAWVQNPVWEELGLKPRQFPSGMVVNDSVRQRMSNCGGGSEKLERNSRDPIGPYRPSDLP